jgi:hypothetical protein
MIRCGKTNSSRAPSETHFTSWWTLSDRSAICIYTGNLSCKKLGFAGSAKETSQIRQIPASRDRHVPVIHRRPMVGIPMSCFFCPRFSIQEAVSSSRYRFSSSSSSRFCFFCSRRRNIRPHSCADATAVATRKCFWTTQTRRCRLHGGPPPLPPAQLILFISLSNFIWIYLLLSEFILFYLILSDRFDRQMHR